jgi:hypothetical protein
VSRAGGDEDLDGSKLEDFWIMVELRSRFLAIESFLSERIDRKPGEEITDRENILKSTVSWLGPKP